MPQNPTRQVHALLAGFVQDTLIDDQNQHHKCLDKLDNQLTRLLHELCSLARTKNHDLPRCLLKRLTLFLPSDLLKKRQTYFDQNNCQARKYFMLTKMPAEKLRLLLLPKPLPRKDKPILKTYDDQPRTKPKLRNKANQNHCQPKRQWKTLNLILATRQRQPKIMPAHKTLPTKKPNLKTCLLKKYWPNTLLWKAPPLKGIWIYEPISKWDLRIRYGFAFALWLCHPTVCVTCGWAGVDKTPRAGFCSGVENARKCRRIPPVKCTLC